MCKLAVLWSGVHGAKESKRKMHHELFISVDGKNQEQIPKQLQDIK
jgi:hypothetical protein